jgi:DeoR/GlpR family transcriptional regulator of sugar metabolism
LQDLFSISRKFVQSQENSCKLATRHFSQKLKTKAFHHKGHEERFSMLNKQRKQTILDILKRDGQIIAKILSEEWGLSEDTIRRDLRELAQEGLLQRVHGGALPASPAVVDFAGREEILHESKVAVGKAAAELIRDGQVVMLDGGTTAVQVARHLPKNLQATIITHSPSIAIELVEHRYLEVILIGGRLFKHSIVSVGAAAIEAISRIRADIFFMGATGIHPEAGLSTGDLEEAYVKHAFCKQAAETFVLATHEKLGAASQYTICGLEEITGLIVEATVPDEILQPFAERGLSIIRGEA